MDLEEAVAMLEAKLSSPTFRKAIGKSAAEAIETLLAFYKCNIVLSKDHILKLLNDYYIFESKISQIIKIYEELSRGSLSAVLRMALGEDAELPDVGGDLLLKELERYGAELFKLRELVREAERKCYSSTSSKA